MPISVLAQEMELLFGHVVDHSELTDEPTASVLAETERLWALHYGETGPYATAGQTTQTEPVQHADGVAVTLPCGREAPSWEAVAAKISVEASDVEKDAQWLPALRAFVAKNVRSNQLEPTTPRLTPLLLNTQTTEELCEDEHALRQWVEGYARFLADCKHALGDQTQQDRHEGPTYEIDLVWYKLCVHLQLMDRLGLIVTDVCRVCAKACAHDAPGGVPTRLPGPGRQPRPLAVAPPPLAVATAANDAHYFYKWHSRCTLAATSEVEPVALSRKEEVDLVCVSGLQLPVNNTTKTTITIAR